MDELIEHAKRLRNPRLVMHFDPRHPIGNGVTARAVSFSATEPDDRERYAMLVEFDERTHWPVHAEFGGDLARIAGKIYRVSWMPKPDPPSLAYLVPQGRIPVLSADGTEVTLEREHGFACPECGISLKVSI